MAARMIELCFCVDTTGLGFVLKSDTAEIMAGVIKKLVQDSGEELDFRVRFLSFRDYETEKTQAMTMTPFFDPYTEGKEMAEAFQALPVGGGGDLDENGLEALYIAMKGPWGDEDYQRPMRVIILITDANAVELLKRKGCEGYPEDMVDFDGLVKYWNEDTHSRRLILLAPSNTYYEQLAEQCKYSRFIVNYDQNALSAKESIESIYSTIVKGY